MAPGWYGKGVALMNYAKCLLYFGRLEEAETALLEAHEILVGAFGPNHPGVYKAISLIVEVYEASNEPRLAEQWRANLPPPAAEEPAGERDAATEDSGD